MMYWEDYEIRLIEAYACLVKTKRYSIYRAVRDIYGVFLCWRTYGSVYAKLRRELRK